MKLRRQTCKASSLLGMPRCPWLWWAKRTCWRWEKKAWNELKWARLWSAREGLSLEGGASVARLVLAALAVVVALGLCQDACQPLFYW